MFESAKNAGLEREAANAIVSAACNGYITFMWEAGKKVPVIGPAMQRTAMATHLTLEGLMRKDFLNLVVPKEMLDPNLRAQFQGERQS